MQTIPDKFQSMVLLQNQNVMLQFNVNGTIPTSSYWVKLLGVYLDNDFNFNSHVMAKVKRLASS